MNTVHYIRSLCLLALLCLSCSSFIKEEQITGLKKYETGRYVLGADITVNDNTLKKGEPIKLLLEVTKEAVKVYGYSTQVEFLKAKRVLLLYMFEDEFKDSKFSPETFEQRLNTIVSTAPPEKKK